MRAPFPIVALVVLTLSGCVEVPQPDPPSPQPYYDVFAFFSGATQGRGRLMTLLSSGTPVSVSGRGRVDAGTLILDQSVTLGRKPPTTRQWRIRQIAPGRYAGTLTDTTGITGTVTGNRLHLIFTMKGGFAAQQWLTLASDGRSAHNIMTVSKFGVRVAALDEMIKRQ